MKRCIIALWALVLVVAAMLRSPQSIALGAVITAAVLALTIHNAGIAHSLRVISSFFWATALAYEKGLAEVRRSFNCSFHDCMKEAAKFQQQREA